MKSAKQLHLLICGLGSIGRRHLRHFRALGVGRIDAYRTSKATLPDDGQPEPDRVYSDLSEALAQQPNAVVITNPTYLHVPTAISAVRAGCHVLIEKPLSYEVSGCEELIHEADQHKVSAIVAQNMRYHPALLQIHRWANTQEPLGEALLARAHFGAYLPDWHPWEDYRGSYAARQDMGGGAALTSIHELDYMLWIMGSAEQCHALDMGKRPLGTDVDEAVAYVIRHNGGTLSSITLELAHRPPRRTLEISFKRGLVNLNLLTGHCSAIDGHGKPIEHQIPGAGFDIDQTYRDQAAAFLELIRGVSVSMVTVNEALDTLKVALAFKGGFHVE